MPASPFFRPEPHWVGDVIPFQKDGVFYLFYLHDVRAAPKPGCSWHLVTTRDLVAYTDHGEVLPHGGPGDADFNAYTGSVITDDAGLFHLFYTGHNPSRLGPDGAPVQLVMHATSTDLVDWTKHPEETFGAGDGYETSDWRDPYVYRPAPGGPWEMLLAARHLDGPERRRGVVARCVSDDLTTWHMSEPLWDPHRFITQECPEIFRMGEWWYLVYSEFSDSFQTRYRMARSPEGPWIAPAHDTIDGRGFYAAKSAERDGRRFFFGWIPSKEGSTDDGAWQWAGTLSAIEAVQKPDGTLGFCIPREVLGLATDHIDPELPDHTVNAPTSYEAYIGKTVLPSRARICANIDIAPGTAACGLLLRASADGDIHYALRLEPNAGRMVLDRWPRKTTGSEQWQISGDVPRMPELDRPSDLSGAHHRLDVILHDDILVATLDESVTLSTRIYGSSGSRV